MEIKTRAFPYPVLGPNFDDFTEGSLRLANAIGEASPERYVLRFELELSHPCIARLIEAKDAYAVVLVECRQNYYRQRHAIGLGCNELIIPADELCGIVQVSPLVSAACELVDYRPSCLHPDYHGLSIRVPRHGILAFGPNFEFIAEPRSDRLRKISSIMRVVQSEVDTMEMSVNIEGPRIRVELPSKQFRFYQRVATSRQGSAILASMLVLPALVHVFHRIRGDTDSLEDFRWFQVVSLRLREIALPIDAADFDPMKAAQALLDSPFGRGIAELVESLGLGEGD